MDIKNEPALVTSGVVALAGIVAPNIVIGPSAQSIITGAVMAVIAIAGGFHIRGKVTPTSVLTAAKSEAKEAVTQVENNPQEIADIIESLTTGEHPMSKMPVAGLDPSLPDPQPQGTYDASVEPNPLASK